MRHFQFMRGGSMSKDTHQVNILFTNINIVIMTTISIIIIFIIIVLLLVPFWCFQCKFLSGVYVQRQGCSDFTCFEPSSRCSFVFVSKLTDYKPGRVQFISTELLVVGSPATHADSGSQSGCVIVITFSSCSS